MELAVNTYEENLNTYVQIKMGHCSFVSIISYLPIIIGTATEISNYYNLHNFKALSQFN